MEDHSSCVLCLYRKYYRKCGQEFSVYVPQTSAFCLGSPEHCCAVNATSHSRSQRGFWMTSNQSRSAALVFTVIVWENCVWRSQEIGKCAMPRDLYTLIQNLRARDFLYFLYVFFRYISYDILFLQQFPSKHAFE